MSSHVNGHEAEELAERGFREVQVGLSGRDLAQLDLRRRDRVDINGTRFPRFTTTYDSSAEHYVIEPHGTDDDFTLVRDAVDWLIHEGELGAVFVDEDHGQIAVAHNQEIAAEHDRSDEPFLAPDLCGVIAELVEAALDDLARLATAGAHA